MPRITLLLLLLLAIATAGCAGSDGETASTDVADASTAATTTGENDFGSIPDVITAVEPSVVTILVSGSQGSGSGSGVIWDDEGRIVTNNHVVTGAEEVEVVLATGVQLPAQLVG